MLNKYKLLSSLMMSFFACSGMNQGEFEENLGHADSQSCLEFSDDIRTYLWDTENTYLNAIPETLSGEGIQFGEINIDASIERLQRLLLKTSSAIVDDHFFLPDCGSVQYDNNIRHIVCGDTGNSRKQRFENDYEDESGELKTIFWEDSNADGFIDKMGEYPKTDVAPEDTMLPSLLEDTNGDHRFDRHTYRNPDHYLDNDNQCIGRGISTIISEHPYESEGTFLRRFESLDGDCGDYLEKMQRDYGWVKENCSK